MHSVQEISLLYIFQKQTCDRSRGFLFVTDRAQFPRNLNHLLVHAPVDANMPATDSSCLCSIKGNLFYFCSQIEKLLDHRTIELTTPRKSSKNRMTRRRITWSKYLNIFYLHFMLPPIPPSTNCWGLDPWPSTLHPQCSPAASLFTFCTICGGVLSQFLFNWLFLKVCIWPKFP